MSENIEKKPIKKDYKSKEYLDLLKKARLNKVTYTATPSIIKSLAAGIDYVLIFIVCFILSYFFRGYIHHIMSHSFDDTLGNNIDINTGVNSLYATGENTSYFNSFLSGFNDIFYLSIVAYAAWWGLVASFFFTGKTPGTRLFKLKLCDVKYRGYEATLLQRAIRCTVFFIDFCFLFGIGTFFSLFNKEKRTLAEYASNTIILTRVD